MTTNIKERIREKETALRSEFRDTFKIDGVTYKGNRHWKETVKYRYIENFWLSKLDQAVKEREEEIVGKIEKKRCSEPFPTMTYLGLDWNSHINDIIRLIKEK